MTTLREALLGLARARAETERLTAEVANAMVDLSQTPEAIRLAEAKERLRAQQEETVATDRAVRDVALEQFRATGDKKPDGRVSIIMRKHPVYNMGEAKLWCKDNAPFLFLLDVKMFEKDAEMFAERGAPVHVEHEPEVRLSAHLGDLLLGEEVEA